MIDIDFSDISELVDSAIENMKKFKPTPLFFFPYLKRVLTESFEREKPQFPMDIRLPKSNEHLLRGDYEPSKIIHLEEPIRMKDGTPMWFRNSAPGCNLRFGYENLDARKICNVVMDMKIIHGFLGGSSGHGKSVLLNAMQAALFYEYAPWEVAVHQSDAKIVEFKKYGVGHRIPHIRNIAATEDADYVISVLEEAFNEMQIRAKIMGAEGASNLKELRKKINLALPQIIIIMDEVESTFKLAGKQAGKIVDNIDGYARLGRAAGIHVIMATQNLTAAIPQTIMGQVGLRMCTGAQASVSEAVLGNVAAQENMGRIGKLIVNTSVLNGGDTAAHNVQFQCPFLTDENFQEEMEELERVGKDIGYPASMSFYDEVDIKLLSEFSEVIDKCLAEETVEIEKLHQLRERVARENPEELDDVPPDHQNIYLGYPAFVLKDGDGLLKIKLNQEDIENIMICASSTESIGILLNIIAHSLSPTHVIMHYTSDPRISKILGAHCKFNIDCRDASAPPLCYIDRVVRCRLFLKFLDSSTANVTYNAEAVEKNFKELGIPQEYWGNSLLCKRYTAYAVFKEQATKSVVSEGATMYKSVAAYYDSFAKIFADYQKYNAIINPVQKSSFSRACYMVGDLTAIIGYGRDSKSKLIEQLKKFMQDCNQVGILVVTYATNTEGLGDLYSGLRYVLFDQCNPKDWSRMKTDEPVGVKESLVVLYDQREVEHPQKKFKRTLLRDKLAEKK